MATRDKSEPPGRGSGLFVQTSDEDLIRSVFPNYSHEVQSVVHTEILVHILIQHHWLKDDVPYSIHF